MSRRPGVPVSTPSFFFFFFTFSISFFIFYFYIYFPLLINICRIEFSEQKPFSQFWSSTGRQQGGFMAAARPKLFSSLKDHHEIIKCVCWKDRVQNLREGSSLGSTRLSQWHRLRGTRAMSNCVKLVWILCDWWTNWLLNWVVCFFPQMVFCLCWNHFLLNPPTEKCLVFNNRDIACLKRLIYLNWLYWDLANLRQISQRFLAGRK